MAGSARLKLEGRKAEQAAAGFLRSLLENKIADAILVPKLLPSKDGFAQVLIRNPGMLEDTSVLTPTMPVQSARILSSLSRGASEGRIAAVLKPCEIRAAVELAKFLQINPDNIILIGVDCPGTFETHDYAEMIRGGAEPEAITDGLIEKMGRGEAEPPSGISFRNACGICEHPVPEADIVFGLYGYETGSEIGITAGEKMEKELTETGLMSSSDSEPEARTEAVARIMEKRTARKEEVYSELRGKLNAPETFLDHFSTCVRCRNCMEACPICYCRECIFKTPVFEHEAGEYLKWADRKRGIRMPMDTLLFHVIRMSHMATSCVGCGLCESACPSRLPVAALFGSIGENLQKMFEYVPGRDIEEVPPVATFKEEELPIES